MGSRFTGVPICKRNSIVNEQTISKQIYLWSFYSKKKRNEDSSWFFFSFEIKSIWAKAILKMIFKPFLNGGGL